MAICDMNNFLVSRRPYVCKLRVSFLKLIIVASVQVFVVMVLLYVVFQTSLPFFSFIHSIELIQY
jgi:hypothetical protein